MTIVSNQKVLPKQEKQKEEVLPNIGSFQHKLGQKFWWLGELS